MGRLDGKTAIITGGATGIGEAIVHKFAKEGARVVVAGLPEDPVDDVVAAVREHGGEALAVKCDVAKEGDARACVDLAVETFGSLDVLVNNAGVFLAAAETDEYPVEAFDSTLRNNVRSAFLMTKFALPHLQASGGNILAAGSESGAIGLANNTPYGGTKGWMHAFVQGVAAEQGKHGVRANCYCPGPIDTAWTHHETGPMTEEMEEGVVQGNVLGRRGTPEEVANVCAFLASDEASYVTGSLVFVDGGTVIDKGGIGAKVPEKHRQQPKGHLDLEHSREGLEQKETVTLV